MEISQYTLIAYTALGLIAATAYLAFKLSKSDSAKETASASTKAVKEAVKELAPTASNSKSKSKKKADKTEKVQPVVEAKKKDEPKKAEKKKKRATQQNTPPTTKPANVQPTVEADVESEVEDDGDILEWAKRATVARSGVELKASAASNGATARTVKQSALNASIPEISDMLPAPGPAPTTLTLATPLVEKSANGTKKAAPAPTESKKQRQNRKKAEQQREANAEAAKEQKMLEEQQRRRAREARGEAAKNGEGAGLTETSGNIWNGSRAPASVENAKVAQAQAAPPSVHDSTESTHELTENDDGWLQVSKKKTRREREDGSVGEKEEVAGAGAAVAATSVPNILSYRPPILSPGIGHRLDSRWTVQ